MRKYLTILALYAFAISIIWENLHAYLYVQYDELMNEMLFVGCALGDVLLTFVIYGMTELLYKNKSQGHRFSVRKLPLLLLVAGLVSFIAEWLAVQLDFWSYTENMPIVPKLGIGLSPFLAIIIISVLSLFLTSKTVKLK
jgi:hypothetical protein